MVREPNTALIQQLFESRVLRDPSAPALGFMGQVLSYHQLNTRANRLAHHLRTRGVGPDSRVALCLERSPQMLVGVLAVLKAGGAYVPLDPNYPAQRLAYMLDDCAPRLLLTHAAARHGLTAALETLATSPEVLELDDESAWADCPADNPDPEAFGLHHRHLAYVIYTSGSTGMPKGVMVEHRGLVNLARVQGPLFEVDRGCRVLQFASFSFDASVFEWVMALTHGACLEIADPGTLLLGDSLVHLLRERHISHATLPPLVLAGLGEPDALPALTTLVLAGEAPNPALAASWAVGRRLFNAYGPTETTIWATVYRCNEQHDPDCPVPIGEPIDRASVVLLDESGVPVRTGEVGELFIGGIGVARGYLNRAELSAERFVDSPFVAGERLYRTGDLARFDTDGQLLFLGRCDFQVKVRGFRIEPGEIETCLERLPGVEEALVIAREDTPGERRLVAYYLADSEVSPRRLREHARRALPEHMLPAACVRLRQWPLNSNGKLDRQALPVPDAAALISSEYVPPRSELEQWLADIWAEVLKVERVGREDNFLALGGDSLSALQISVRVREQGGRSLPLKSLFLESTLHQVAQRLSEPMTESAPQEPVTGGASPIAPLSYQQSGVWWLNKVSDARAYHAQSVIGIQGQIEVALLQRCLDEIVARHEIFRTTFHADGEGVPYQRVHEHARAALTCIDIPADDEPAFNARVSAQVQRDIDVASLPLVRWLLVRRGVDSYALVHIEHHFVHDGWSANLFLEELLHLYQFHHGDRSDPLPAPGAQYADYARWQQSPAAEAGYDRQLLFWKEQLQDVPFTLPLPTDFPRPAQRSGRGRQLRFELPVELAARLRQFSEAEGVTVFTTLFTAFQLWLGRRCGIEDFLVGSAVANRKSVAHERCLGMFVNSVVIRADLSGAPSFRQLLRRTAERALDVYDHESVPFERLVREFQPSRSLSRNPLFQVAFSFHNSQTPRLQGPGFDLSLFEAYSNQTAKFDLEVVLIPRGTRADNPDTLSLLWNYSVDLFKEDTMTRLRDNYLDLLGQCLEAPERHFDSDAVIGAEERQRLLNEWNHVTLPGAAPRCLHQLFEARVELDPWAPAVSCEGQTLGYRELNARANRLARHLRTLGVGPDVLVGLCVERSPDMVVGLLAILKAGGAYVPLDPVYPSERLHLLLADSAPAVVLTHAAARPSLTAACKGLVSKPRLLDLEADATRWAERPDDNLDPREIGLTANHLAYVIYTSGSTGTPKGVMIEHAQVARLFASTAGQFHFDSDDVWTLFHSFAFDFSVWEIWGALLHGGRLVIVPTLTSRTPADFYQLLCEQGVTVLNQTPSAFRSLLGAQARNPAAHSLRCVVFGGEALEPTSLKPWFADPRNSEAQLVNMYGITEITVHATYLALRAEDAEQPGASPIGRPLADLRCYLLDPAGQLLPIGAEGEIHIGGAGVARGYLNRAQLTAERFIDNPFVAGDRLYRTGDLARYRADGNLEFLGRNDFQVKIRGFRIELGEIEACLGRCGGVREAVVIAREDQPGEPRLVAYYTAVEGAVPNVRELRAQLTATLPEHMVPAAYVGLEALPLTANGKLDRRALPAPDDSAFGTRPFSPAQGPVEIALAEAWAHVLGRERIGRDDNFFALGGHSLSALRVLERLRRQGIELDARLMFSAPVLRELAAGVEVAQIAAPIPANGIVRGLPITPECLPLATLDQAQIDAIVATVPGGADNVQDIYPLSPLQEGMLFHHLMARNGDPYLLWSLMSFSDRATLDRYVQALETVIERHDILRTSMFWDDLEQPVQVVWRQVGGLVEELQLDPADGDIAGQLRQRFDPRHYRLPLDRAPLMRMMVARDDTHERWLGLRLFHHIIDDNTSLKQLNAEVEAVLGGQADSLLPALPYRNFIAQRVRGGDQQAQEQFFRGMLAGVTEPCAPFGLLDIQGDGSGIGEARLQLDGDLAQRLRQAAQALGVSPASLFHVAWGQVVAHTSGRHDVVFGTVLFGRLYGGEGAERILGPFINTLPIRIDLAAEGVAACVRRTHRLLTQLFEHEHASLALAQRCSGIASPTPLFTTLLNYRHSERATEGGDSTSGAWKGIQVLGGEERTNYPLVLAVDDSGEGFRIGAQVCAALDAQRTCAMMQRALKSLVAALEQAPQSPVERLDILPANERRLLLEEWNPLPGTLADSRCLHQGFERQATAQPSATALSFEGTTLSYGELNVRANRLAHYLCGRGVGPEVRVGLCVERSLEMLVGLLAILKAGGAYVPLDPAYPGERLRHLLDDSGVPLVLHHGATRSVLDKAISGLTTAPDCLDLDNPGDWAGCPADNLDPQPMGLTAASLAYVIYTSGSTGTPKGVMIEHRHVARLFTSTAGPFAFNRDDVWTLFHSFAFDFSVWEIWGALLHGGRLVIVPGLTSRNPADFHQLLCEQRVTVLNQTPSAFRGLLDAQARSPATHSLRCVVFGGEALEPTSLKPWYADPRNSDTQLINMYGITEITVHATYLALRPQDAEQSGASPIGRPLADLRCYLLDSLGQLVPVGVAGEIHIGGAGVARGYLNRAALTAERFIDNPFVAGERLYRTGDLARYRPDGSLEFLGRNDFQVKIRGFRIEPGEIEACLRQCAGVREAVVIAREEQPGEVRLVAYCTGAEGAAVDVVVLREQVVARLPGHLVPTAYVLLDTLPLTANGKLDRQALPAPGEGAFAVQGFVAPSTPIESALARIWCEVLRCERVGLTDNFFHLGGHSLLATRIVARIEDLLGIELPMRVLFDHPTIEAVLDHLFTQAQENRASP
ncbi:non-ribosomal peptide synthetase [Pseudomonas gingeri]|uniref:non-ribosomal peptide synthetase n=1 Tax=Pseudomonas gingeri TaxID=117681 RepID=UPI0015A49A78|nr:non-ribosomal peptide synthetase [Pseudomonas gingeri]NWA02234.1 amino acid adenylation domain-containing protein [Pseudomonas gingeri]NWA17897.1 amino acid adenylation domain-containing protein [Pseudomonas gingeri]NWA56810.1 amino acid adenylation domain-containing protein [Pseudomonas gingeri]NWA97113.1 amino acid adenylation domain-containing protein [Pseudomonas gingeri]NWB03686.1 amino acid adenylation domain-containing protein [Pseudomonas gingeri]